MCDNIHYRPNEVHLDETRVCISLRFPLLVTPSVPYTKLHVSCASGNSVRVAAARAIVISCECVIWPPTARSLGLVVFHSLL